jgi:hypothetical protein
VEHFSVFRRHPWAELREIRFALPPQHVGDGRHGLLHQLVDRGDRLLLPLGGEVQIDHCRLQAAMGLRDRV